MSSIKHLDLPPSVHGIVTHLTEHVNDITELYVVIQTKKGDVYECVSGDMKGLAFAILVLQYYALDQLRHQQ